MALLTIACDLSFLYGVQIIRIIYPQGLLEKKGEQGKHNAYITGMGIATSKTAVQSQGRFSINKINSGGEKKEGNNLIERRKQLI